MLANVLIVMLTDIKLGDQERDRQIAKLKNLANINRYMVCNKAIQRALG
jgi:hypothetical protein